MTSGMTDKKWATEKITELREEYARIAKQIAKLQSKDVSKLKERQLEIKKEIVHWQNKARGSN